MIYITGDVHSRRFGGFEQLKNGPNIVQAIKYLEILKKYKLSSTLFINGICLEEETSEVKKLLEFDVELGGHTYNNFGSMKIIKSYIYRKLWNCIYGPNFFQERDISKTKKSFDNFGIKITSWRTHAFGSNESTFKLLKKYGITHVSDLLGDQNSFFKDGIIHMPINIPVDQNTIAYGPLNPENRDCFASCTKGRINPKEWFEILKKRVEKNEGENMPSIILIHPATMAYLDEFRLFEDIARFLSKYKSGKISEYKLKF